MFITVHLTPDAAANVRGEAHDVNNSLQQKLDSLGVQLEALHPGAMDQELAGQFYADVDAAFAAETCTRLLEHPAVIAAYTKPPGTTPGSSV